MGSDPIWGGPVWVVWGHWAVLFITWTSDHSGLPRGGLHVLVLTMLQGRGQSSWCGLLAPGRGGRTATTPSLPTTRHACCPLALDTLALKPSPKGASLAPDPRKHSAMLATGPLSSLFPFWKLPILNSSFCGHPAAIPQPPDQGLW
jgi:hypothetical protein